MPLMRSPDGRETMEVPDNLVAHYESLGATVAPAPGQPRFVPPTPDAPMQYLGEEDEMGLEEPGFLDPLNFLPGAAALRAGGLAAVQGAQGLGRMAKAGLGGVRRAVMAGKASPTARQAAIEAMESIAAERSRIPGLQVAGANLGRAEMQAAQGLRQAAPAASTAQGEASIAEWLARNPGQPVAEVAEQGSKVAGSIKPGSAASRAPKPKPKPKAKAPKKAAEKPGSAISRAETPKGRETPEGVDSRHEVQYFSESKGKYQNIESMNQVQIERAYNKLAAKDPKKGSLGRRVLEALLEESKHRAKTTGIHVGHAG